MKEFDGKVAIVTGTTGIGRAIAKRFAAGGASVLACGIEAAANQELAHEAKEFEASQNHWSRRRRCELETRLSRMLTCRASAETLCFGIVNALKCDPVHVLDAGRPTALARMEQA